MADSTILHMGSPAAPPSPNEVSLAVSTNVDPFTGTIYSVDQGTPVTPDPDGSGVILAQGDDIDTSVVTGLASSAGEAPGSVRARFAGPLTLTTEQWDARVTGQSGGLTPNAIYYLSAAANGKLTKTPPSSPDFVTPVGFALSATTMMIQIQTPVVGAG
jgi:hypothetical protein